MIQVVGEIKGLSNLDFGVMDSESSGWTCDQDQCGIRINTMDKGHS
jgi:hypothetical protein